MQLRYRATNKADKDLKYLTKSNHKSSITSNKTMAKSPAMDKNPFVISVYRGFRFINPVAKAEPKNPPANSKAPARPAKLYRTVVEFFYFYNLTHSRVTERT